MPRVRGQCRRLIAVGTLLAVLLLAPALGVSTVSAHALLDTADPPAGVPLAQAPTSLTLTFSEAMVPQFSHAQVLDTRGQQVDNGDSHVTDDPTVMVVTLKSGLPNGVYTVTWRTVSEVDGHEANGAYPLIVGPMPAEGIATATVPDQQEVAPENVIARAWLALAASGLVGTFLTWWLVFGPLLRRPEWRAPRAVGEKRARLVAVFSGGLIILATLYAAVVEAHVSDDVPFLQAFGQPLADVLLQGHFAAIWWPRLGLAVLATALVAWRGPVGRPAQVAAVAAAGVLLTSSLTSHAAALQSGAYLVVVADWAHFLAVGTWIGGLANLVVVLPALLRAAGPGAAALRAAAIKRFSTLALVSVAVIVVTGTFQAWVEVGSWDGLFQTLYGQSIVVKIVLLLVMLALAGFNLLVARKRLADAARRSQAAAGLVRSFGWAVRGELAVGIVVLLVAGVLTSAPPAREELAQISTGQTPGGPLDKSVQAQGLNAEIQVNPAQVGVNRLAVILPDVDPSIVERVQLTFTYLDQSIGDQPQILDQVSASPPTWAVDSPVLAQPGGWQAELLVRRAGQDDARTAVRFSVAGPGVTEAPVVARYPFLPAPMTSVAYLVIAIGFGLIVYAFVRRGSRARKLRATFVGAGLVVALCGGYVYAEEQKNGVPLDVVNVRDPIPPDAQSLAQGKEVYEDHCAACHGESGRGDGPAGARLIPPPADLRVHMAAGHTDGQLFYWVTYGEAGTAMPAWGNLLTEDQRWDVINYIRTFAQTPSTTPTPGT